MKNNFRIVSLCPSTTLSLVDLALEDSIVGRTIFCKKPKKIMSIQSVGGTKNPNFEKIKALKPTHILFNLEENDASHLSEIESIAESIVTTPTTIDESNEMIAIFGEAFKRQKLAKEWIQKIEEKRDRIREKTWQKLSYLYFIWQEPFMFAGKNSYIESILSLFSAQNLARELSNERYPVLSEEEVLKANADLLLFSSEPFPFRQKHLERFPFQAEKMQLIDGEAASWHGSYSAFALDYLSDFFTFLERSDSAKRSDH